MLGNSKRNRWCAFCIHWYDPTNSVLTPKSGRDMFDVDNKKICKCMVTNLKTKALATCPKFTPKF